MWEQMVDNKYLCTDVQTIATLIILYDAMYLCVLVLNVCFLSNTLTGLSIPYTIYTIMCIN